jgi:hypothetical protein
VKPLSAIAIVLGLACVGPAAVGLAGQAPSSKTPDTSALVGVWTLNAGLSDKPPARANDGSDGGQSGRHGGGGYGGGGGHRGGGFGGGGYGRGGGYNSGQGGEPDDARMRQIHALRELMEAADKLTITSTDTMVIVTAGDGRTTRLQTDGHAVKDDSTKIERRTRWSNGALISELSGLPRGKAKETYTADPATHRLTVVLTLDGVRQREGQSSMLTITRVYDAQAQ